MGIYMAIVPDTLFDIISVHWSAQVIELISTISNIVFGKVWAW